MNGESKIRLLWKPILLAIIIAALFVLSQVIDLGEKFAELRGWIDSLGVWGPIAYIFIYIVSVIAVVPGSAMTVAAGVLFGSLKGVVVVIIGATLGAALAFLIARYFARESIANWLSCKERFRKLDDMSEKHGALIVAVTRLVPIFPFVLLNYGFGLTKVKFWTYVLWSFVCMLPGTILYVVGTDVVFQGIQKGEAPWALIGVLAVAVVLMVTVVRYARRRMREKGIEG